MLSVSVCLSVCPSLTVCPSVRLCFFFRCCSYLRFRALVSGYFPFSWAFHLRFILSTCLIFHLVPRTVGFSVVLDFSRHPFGVHRFLRCCLFSDFCYNFSGFPHPLLLSPSPLPLFFRSFWSPPPPLRFSTPFYFLPPVFFWSGKEGGSRVASSLSACRSVSFHMFLFLCFNFHDDFTFLPLKIRCGTLVGPGKGTHNTPVALRRDAVMAHNKLHAQHRNDKTKVTAPSLDYQQSLKFLSRLQKNYHFSGAFTIYHASVFL